MENTLNDWLATAGFILIVLGVIVAIFGGMGAGGGISLAGIAMAGVGASGFMFPLTAISLAVMKEHIQGESAELAFALRLPVYGLCALLSGEHMALVLVAAAVDLVTVRSPIASILTAAAGVVLGVVLLVQFWNTPTEFLAAWGLVAFMVLLMKRVGEWGLERNPESRSAEFFDDASILMLIVISFVILQILLPVVSLFADL